MLNIDKSGRDKESLADTPGVVVGALLGPDDNGSFGRLLAAFSNLRKTGRHAKLVCFAPHKAQQPARESALQQFGLEAQWVPNELSMRDLLPGCDVLVSLQDGVPLLVLQAMSLGIPIITTAVRVPEVLRNHGTVTFIRPSDPIGLREALLRLPEDSKRKLIPNFVCEGSIAKYYSDTYLWRESASQNASVYEPNGRAPIKKALFSAVPSQQLLEHGSRDRARVALTIDDGPDPVCTPRLLDILRDHAVKATFFVVGGAAEQYPELVVRMKKEGHDVGSHSYSHPYFHRLSWAGAIREIAMTRSVLGSILGEECKLFRPPHGKLALRSLIPAWMAGQQVVMWNVDLKDYRAAAGEVEARLARTSFSSGDIILYHGINEPALTALPRVIEAAIDDRREAVTISKLMQPEDFKVDTGLVNSDSLRNPGSERYSSHTERISR